MARSIPWRRTISDVCSWRQDQAANATIYILRETGPTGFLLKEEGETKKFKVYLGDPHSCTCPEFKKDKDLCKHICWVLLKKFRVPRQNPVTWQLGLVEREINEILRGIAAARQRPTPNARRIASEAGEATKENEEAGSIQQREIGEDDVCPICQEELLEKRLPVTYCRHGCGNNIHIKCMKVWAEHQKGQGSETIKCPMCRENFGSISVLQQEMRNSTVRETRAQMNNEHLGTACKKCYTCPIVGKCYKCSVCAEYYLCQTCFNTPTHEQHHFQYREKPNQRWRDAVRGTGTLLPDAVVNNLMQRDISEADYDLLLQLDNQSSQQLSDLTEETVHSFPLQRVRMNSTLLAPGQQCRVCLRPYQEGQMVRQLLCRHKFHRECIDNWLLHRHPTCPIDGTMYTNDSVRQIREANRLRQQRQREENAATQNGRLHPNNTGPDTTLQIPGIGIASLGNSRVLDRHMNGLLEISGFSGNNGNMQSNGPQNGSRVSSDVAIDSNRMSNGIDVENTNDEMNVAPSLFVANRHSNPAFPSNTRQSGPQSRRGRVTQPRGRLRGSGVSRESANIVSSELALENHGLQYQTLTSDDRRHSATTSAVLLGNDNQGLGSINSSIRNLQPLGEIRHNPNDASRSNDNITAPNQERTTGISFANLLMADIQRTISRQSNHSHDEPVNDSSQVDHTSSTRVADSDTSVEMNNQQGGTAPNQPGVFNLNINHIQSSEQRSTGASKKGQRVKGVLKERNLAAPTTNQGGLDVSGTTVNGGHNGQSASDYSHIMSSTTPARVPVPPSIPLPRDARDISLGGAAGHKPPSGGSTRSRPGRVRSRLLNKELHRIRSNSRERASSAERNNRNQTRDLYIGNDPDSTEGFVSDFVVSTTEQTRTAKKRSGQDRYRWGSTQNMVGSSISLSGNALGT